MYKIDFQTPIHIHFIGIGGISMSGLAEILIDRHFPVSGSDMKSSEITDHLKHIGARIAIGQRAENITDDIDLVVYTAAIHENNEEFAAAKAKGIPMMTRAALLGQIMDNYARSIAVAGTHGKTTTTSMLADILLQGSMDPTVSVGGMLDQIGGNIRVGQSDVFLTEACEYTNSFLEFHPLYSIILNVEEDHMDFFKDIDDIRKSFRAFAHKLPDYGYLVINGEIDNISYITDGLEADYVTFGVDRSRFNFAADNITHDAFGHDSFDYYKNGVYQDRIQLNVTGDHNVNNALAAIAVADRLNLPMEAVKKGLLSFSGAKRRFEYKGKVHGFTIIDDYAHHPTEIRATLEACKNYPHEELWCIFQPHTYTRTKAFLDDFAKALSLSDHVIITDIYAAREKDTGLVHARDIVDKMSAYDVDVHYISSFEDIEKFILKNCKENDLLITMGAGNVDSIGNSLLKK